MTRVTTASLVALALFVAACGGAVAANEAEPDQPTSSPPVAGACLEGVPDCVDTIVEGADPSPDGHGIDEAAMIRDAESLLGQSEEEVLATWADVRVGRRGDEHMMLTEDYVIGRKTVAVEDDGTGTFRVVEVRVELTEGPLDIIATS